MATQMIVVEKKMEETLEVEKKENEKADPSLPVVLKCDRCSIEHRLPSDSWNVRCSCNLLLLAPQKDGFKYVGVTCNKQRIFQVSHETSTFICNCCSQTFKIGDEILKKRSCQDVFETENITDYVLKIEKSNEQLKKEKEELEKELREIKQNGLREEMKASTEKMKTELKELLEEREKKMEEKMKASVEKMKKELREELLKELSKERVEENREKETTVSKTNQESKTTETFHLAEKSKTTLRPALCDSCQITHEIGQWSSKCTTPGCKSRTILADIEPGFRYFMTRCSRPHFSRVPENHTWLTCSCCSREHILGDTIASTYSGQPIYSTELTSEAVKKGKVQLREMEKAIEELQLTVKSLEEEKKSKDEEMNKMKDTNEKAVQLAAKVMAKLAEEAVKKIAG